MRPPAIVLDVGFVNGLAAIRSLGRGGVRVLAVDHRPSALGFRSRYAEPVLAPDPVADEAGFVARVRELGRGVVFATHDEGLNAVARSDLDLLRPFPAWPVLERVQSKREQLEAAARVGVPAPETRHPRTAAEARAAGEELGYPVLVKPSAPIGFKARFRRQAFRCESPEELDAAYAQAQEFEPMVQELVPGGDDELWSLGSYLTEDGEALGLFCGRKLRQTPPGIGTCRVGEAGWVDAVVEQGLALLRALGCHGLSQVEFKRDPRDGRFKLMEVNPRLWQWHSLAAACGVDLPLIAYEHLTGSRVAPARMNGGRRRWAIALMPGERPAVPRPPFVEATFALDDPKPALVHAARVVRGARR